MKKRYSLSEIASWPNGFKRCTGCGSLKELDGFHKESTGLMGRAQKCRSCRNSKFKEAYNDQSPEYRLLRYARDRARVKGIECTISVEDIRIPDKCPVLGIELRREDTSRDAGPNAPSLDRIDSDKGYISGNVSVISWRANTLKNNFSVDELKKLLAYMEA